MEYNNVDELRVIIKKLNQQLESLENGKKAIYEMVLKEKQLFTLHSKNHVFHPDFFAFLCFCKF